MAGGRRRRWAGATGAAGREPWKGEGPLRIGFGGLRCLAGLKMKDDEVAEEEDGAGLRGVVEGVQSIMSESASFVSR